MSMAAPAVAGGPSTAADSRRKRVAGSCTARSLHLWRSALIVAGLAIVGAALLLTRGSSLPVHRPAVVPTVRSAHPALLPAGLLTAASDSIGAVERRYWPTRRDGALRARGGGIHSSFTASGASLRVSGGTLSLSLPILSDGPRPQPLRGTAPSSATDRVLYRSGSIEQSYRNGPYGLEQTFTIARAPRGASGRLMLALRLGGSLTTHKQGSRIVFTSRSGATALTYGQLGARDASGRALPATMSLHDGNLQLRVDDRGARFPVTIDPWVEEGQKLTPGNPHKSYFGYSLALSKEGATALIGAPLEGKEKGAAWVFTRSGSGWEEQAELTAPGAIEGSGGHSGTVFGSSVALAADGSTALVGAPETDGLVSGHAGAAWVFTRSGSTWSAGEKLTGAGEVGEGEFGQSVALSAEGETALIGGPLDDNEVGAAWVFTRSGSTWSAQGAKLTGMGEAGDGLFGSSVALSAEGNTALVGGPRDGYYSEGAVWAFTRSQSKWTQQGAKLTGGEQYFGGTLALSANGNTALVGSGGSAWVLTRSGSTWSQPAAQLIGLDGASELASPGRAVALSADGDTAVVGSLSPHGGSATVFTRSGSSWSAGEDIAGAGEEGGGSAFGSTVALDGDGDLALTGNPVEDHDSGGVWTFQPVACDTWTNTAGGSWWEGSNWSEGVPPASGAAACVTAPGSYTVTLAETDKTVPVDLYSLTVGAGATLRVESSCSSEASLWTTLGIVNEAHGAIALTDGDGCAARVTLGGPIENAGTITTETGEGGGRNLQGQITNSGTIAIEAGTTLGSGITTTNEHNRYGLTNEGALTIADGAVLTVPRFTVLTNTSGAIEATSDGAVLTHGRFVEDEGRTAGPQSVIVDDGELYYDGSGESQITMRGESQLLTGPVGGHQALSIEGTCAEAARASAKSLSNYGSITLTDQGCPKLAELKIARGGSLTDSGTITTLSGHGGERLLGGSLDVQPSGELAIDAGTQINSSQDADLVISGKVEIANGTTLVRNGDGRIYNSGTIQEDGTGTLTQVNGAFYQDGGEITGSQPAILENVRLHYEAPGAASLVLRGAASKLLGKKLSNGEELDIQGTCAESAKVTGYTFTNAGTLELSGAEGCPAGAALDFNGKLVNRGVMDVEDADGGPRAIGGDITNDDLLSLGAGATLALDGDYVQLQAGKLETLIAGPSAFGALTVGGSAAIDGRLIVRQVPPFEASAGETFPILTSSALTGVFSRETGIPRGDRYYKPTYTATGVTLVPTQAMLTDTPSIGAPGTSVTIHGAGFLPGETVTPAFTDHAANKTTFSGVTANAEGEFSTEITIPLSAASGSGDVSSTGAQTGAIAKKGFKVT